MKRVINMLTMRNTARLPTMQLSFTQRRRLEVPKLAVPPFPDMSGIEGFFGKFSIFQTFHKLCSRTFHKLFYKKFFKIMI